MNWHKLLKDTTRAEKDTSYSTFTFAPISSHQYKLHDCFAKGHHHAPYNVCGRNVGAIQTQSSITMRHSQHHSTCQDTAAGGHQGYVCADSHGLQKLAWVTEAEAGKRKRGKEEKRTAMCLKGSPASKQFRPRTNIRT